MGILPLIIKNRKVGSWLNHRNLYLLGLAVSACGLGWSNLLMSLGQFIILGNWIIEFDFKHKIQVLKASKLIWILIAIYLIHIIGLLWTEDFNYGVKDLRIKLPLLIFPLIIGTTKKLNKKELTAIFTIYIVTLLLLTITSFGKLMAWWGQPILDKRELSIYISHIRYGLNLAIATCILIHFNPFKKQIINFLLALWFFSAMLLFQLYTGLIFLLIVSSFYGFYYFLNQIKKGYLRGAIILVTIAAFFFIGIQFFLIFEDFKTVPELTFNQNDVENKFTENGEKYWSDLNDKRKESGIYVRRFIAWKEIETAWNKRSKMEFWSPDKKGQTLDQTLNRFLSSKGLKKDAKTINELSNEEIKAIESGIANVYYLNHNAFQNRIHKTYYELSEYKKTGVANGFSLALRIEYWNTAISIIKDNLLFGVGTGDVKQAFKNVYENKNSLLDEQYKKRTHNQFLTFFVSFGLIGLLILLFLNFYPLFIQNQYKILFLLIIGILLLSFITEDTLETQAGVSLFAFFNSLFVLGIKNHTDS